MSTLRQLVENDCGGLNPLMQLGARFKRDEGLLYQTQLDKSYTQNKEMVNEFLQQVNRPPQTFHMETLLQEMREIEQHQQLQQLKQQQHLSPPHLVAAPNVIEQVAAEQWAKEFNNADIASNNIPGPMMANVPIMDPETKMHIVQLKPSQQQLTNVQEFFVDSSANNNSRQMILGSYPQYHMPEQTEARSLLPHLIRRSFPVNYQLQQQQVAAPLNGEISLMKGLTNQFFDEITQHNQQHQLQQIQADQRISNGATKHYDTPIDADNDQRHQQREDVEESMLKTIGDVTADTTADQWVKDFQKENELKNQKLNEYNEMFWEHLRNEWTKLASEGDEHSWLCDYDDKVYDEYNFLEDNPTKGVANALAKGKEYLAKGDIPSAVLCFEVAVQEQPMRSENWQLLGLAQAENEMDPQAIKALKKAHELNPEEPEVIMALAICYTNESLQSQAVKMLIKWLNLQPNYKQLIPKEIRDEMLSRNNNNSSMITSSIIRPAQKLETIQEIFLSAVRLQPDQIDPRLQEALGVLYNLSSDYDKAVDCFRTALQIQPHNAKIWNRLGASLANGNRSVEAIDAYQRALVLEPGFVRVRYNVGICCLNLKAYHQAVEHLITALNMQANVVANRDIKMASDGNIIEIAEKHMSQSIWSTLKMAVTYLGRTDLIDNIDKRNLDALNAEFREE